MFPAGSALVIVPSDEPSVEVALKMRGSIGRGSVSADALVESNASPWNRSNGDHSGHQLEALRNK